MKDDGSLHQKQKPRLTTDDSWSSQQLVTSRNDGIDPSRWPELMLPTARDLGRAAGILNTAAAPAGIELTAYARDLTAAYRQWGVQAATLWLQCFIWLDGVCVDGQLEFGTSSAVQLFERLTSLLVAYARHLQRQWDRQHPPSSPVVREWLQTREAMGEGEAALGYVHIFIDDTNGVSLNDRHPDWPKGRGAEHFRIVGEVFAAAGFTISPSKDQQGTSILALGFQLDLATRFLIN